MKRDWLRILAFTLMGVMVGILIAATIVEKVYGTENVTHYIYQAPWSIVLWGITALSGIIYFVSRMRRGKERWKQLPTWGIHFSFIIILIGALVTHIWGEQGYVHLRENEETNMYIVGDETRTFPFSITLHDFEIEYYPNTSAPMDYISVLNIKNEGDDVVGEVSMNHILSYQSYRFYQSKYDSDSKGATYSISHDPWGIGITYVGYFMLLMSFITFFISKQTRYRALLEKVKKGSMLIIVLLVCSFANAKDKDPQVLQKGLAETYGNLCVYYNNRVCPMSTLAYEFCQKVYGKDHYKEYSAEQVLTGFLFHYDDWKNEPIIKVSKNVGEWLRIEGKYASLSDFYDMNGYKIASQVENREKNAIRADEKIQLIAMVARGSIFRIWPIKSDETYTHWYSWVEDPPKNIEKADRIFYQGAMDYAAMLLDEGKNVATNEVFKKIKRYQCEKVGEDSLRFKAEQFYYRTPYTKPLAIAMTLIGIILFLIYCWIKNKKKPLPKNIYIGLVIVLGGVWVFLSIMLGIRWYISRHIPLSNGFETMQFLAWITALIALIISKRIRITIPIGYLVCGITLMVSGMAASNPQITNLMPVLQSPLLSIHVCIIMVAYCLLAFVMLNGLAALITGRKNNNVLVQAQWISTLILYPAVFCLGIGIFIGAVWANVSWGRYWGWDPKEVWALITLLIYSAPIHGRSMQRFNNPKFFHIYNIVAFSSVIITYFGVNFLLGGMHSYA